MQLDRDITLCNRSFIQRAYSILSTRMHSLQDARHPADEGFEAQLTWRVYGLSIWSSPASLSGYLDTYHLSLNIMNTGVDPLTGLVIRVSQCSTARLSVAANIVILST